MPLYECLCCDTKLYRDELLPTGTVPLCGLCRQGIDLHETLDIFAVTNPIPVWAPWGQIRDDVVSRILDAAPL